MTADITTDDLARCGVRVGAGFHRTDPDWTRGRALALADADSIARRQDGMARKVTLRTPAPEGDSHE